MRPKFRNRRMFPERSDSKMNETTFGLSKAACDKRSEHNATRSLLARLPLEVRLIIWKFVLGGYLLHVEPRGFYICQSTATPDEEYTNWKAALNSRSDRKTLVHPTSLLSAHEISSSTFYFDHDTCWHYRARGKLPKLGGKGMMRSCKLIYHELSGVFWTTNTFSIQDPEIFEDFMDRLTMRQKQSLTNLHLRGDFDSRWRRVLLGHLIACLSGLRKLQVSVKGAVVNSLFDNGGLSIITVLECLSRFKVLPIEHCTIVIEQAVARNVPYNTKITSGTKSSAQCLKWSERLQSSILKPCSTEEEQREKMAAALAQQICLQASTKHDCWMLYDRFIKVRAMACRKVHVCLICWETNKTPDIRQRFEEAQKCVNPGTCSNDKTPIAALPTGIDGSSEDIQNSMMQPLPRLGVVS